MIEENTKITNLKRLMRIFYWLIKGTAIAVGLSFTYMIIWSVMIESVMQGLSFEQIIAKDNFNGMSKLFIDMFLLSLFLLSLLFMCVESLISCKLELLRIPQNIPSQYVEEMKQIEIELKKSKKSYIAAYIYYAAFIFMMLGFSYVFPEIGKSIVGVIFPFLVAMWCFFRGYKLTKIAFQHRQNIFEITLNCLSGILKNNFESKVNIEQK